MHETCRDSENIKSRSTSVFYILIPINLHHAVAQWAAKDAFWNSGTARRLYRNHMNKLFNRW